MKSLSYLIILFFIVLGTMTAYAQQVINISTSDHASWTVTDNAGIQVPLYDVGECVNNDCIMACLCGPTFPTPQTPNCGNGPVDAIWGEGPTTDNFCDYPVGTYTFTRTFEISDCEQAQHIDWSIIADNHFVLRVNGTIVVANDILFGTTLGNVTDWEREYIITDNAVNWVDYNDLTQNGAGQLEDVNGNPINIPALLVQGTNTISVQVRNAPAGVCSNYAFFSMCGEVDLLDVTPDPGFDAAIYPGTDLTLNVLGTLGPGAQHQWLVFEGPTSNGPWTPSTTLPGPFPYAGPFPNNFPLNAASGTHYRVVHRVNVGDCAACCQVALRYDNVKNTGGSLQQGGSFQSVSALCSPVSCGRFTWFSPNRAAAPSLIRDNFVVSLKPNPVSERLMVESSEAIHSGVILDVNGKTVMQGFHTEGDKSFSIDVNQLAEGVYFLQLQTTQGKAEVQKFVVKKEK